MAAAPVPFCKLILQRPLCPCTIKPLYLDMTSDLTSDRLVAEPLG